VTISLLATAFARPLIVSAGDDPKPPTNAPEARQVEAPIPIFLNAPSDRESFWKMLGRPDLVILDGELYRKLRQAAEPAAKTTGQPLASVVESLAASGEVTGDWAKLSVEYRISLETDGPAWVSIQLDGLTLSEAREGSKELPTRITEGRAWQVELHGKGEHVVRVRLLVPVKSTVEGRRIELAIPPVASTRIELRVPQTPMDATTGLNEMVAIAPVEGGPSARLAARLSPRSRIELVWRERADPAARLPALLSVKGDMAIEVERGSIRTRSSWLVSALRGTSNQLTLRLDPNEEVLDVEVDGKPVQVETRSEAGRSVLSIPLSEPLRASTNRAVTLSTKRSIASSGTAHVALQGYSFDQAKVQTGWVAVARAGPIFLNPTPGRGLRRIDPRTELPDTLRNRADTVLAFEFNDQPFELGLSVEPAPPRLRVENRTTISLDPRSARLQTRLECRTSQGRMFEVQVVLPKGLEFEGAEPPEIVESAQAVPLDSRAGSAGGADAARVLSIVLTPQAREAEVFTIVLNGRSVIDPSRPVVLPLFQPIVNTTTSSEFVMATGRNVTVDLSSAGDEPSSFRPDWGSPPADWVWPNRRPGPEQSLLWLRSDANPETMPLRASVRPRSIRHESTLSASIDRRGAEVVDEISGEVAFGPVSQLDVALPLEVGDHWEVEGAERTVREPMGLDADGTRRYRLRFAREYTDTFRVRIRYRLPFAEQPAIDREGKLRLAPIRVLEGTSTGQRILISAEPGVELKTDAKGWTSLASIDPPAGSENGPPVKIALSRNDEKSGSVGVNVRFGPRLALPSVVVSRLWIKSVQRPENELATTAWFWVETREGTMTVGLPSGSRWLRARVGSTDLGEGGVELLASDEYRIRFPTTTPSGPLLVSIDYAVPSSESADGWPALRLLAGGVVQQSVWEVQVLGTRAGVGTPSGWVNENEWYWEDLLWRRRPWKTEAELANWLTGGNSRYRFSDSTITGDLGGQHRYLFSRVGPPTPLRFAVFSRLTLLLSCSGPILLMGLLALFRRPPPRLIAVMLLAIGFAAGSIIEFDVMLLLLQSSALGIALLVMALAMHWAIERRSQSRARGDRALVVGPSSLGSSLGRGPVVGSDDSTAIRVRPTTPSAVSTADHIVLSRALGHPTEERSIEDLDLR
jgi:hypothetical protein